MHVIRKIKLFCGTFRFNKPKRSEMVELMKENEENLRYEKINTDVQKDINNFTVILVFN